MTPKTIEIIETRTFLEFFEVGVDAKGEYELMRRANTEPNQEKRVADRKVTSIEAVVGSSELSSTPTLLGVSSPPALCENILRGKTNSTQDEDTQKAHSLPAANSTVASSKDLGRKSKKDRKKTTLMFRNLPNDYNRKMFLDLLDCECLAGEYDFVYFPIDFATGSGLGYAFVNFTSQDEALRAWDLLAGYNDWLVPSNKVCEVRWSTPVQGLKANIERYQNSPMMHYQVPDAFKPAIFKNGVRILYPASKRPIKYTPYKKPAQRQK